MPERRKSNGKPNGAPAMSRDRPGGVMVEIGRLKRRMDAVEAFIQSERSERQSADAATDEELQTSNDRMTAIDNRLSAHDERLGSLDTRLKWVESRVERRGRPPKKKTS